MQGLTVTRGNRCLFEDLSFGVQGGELLLVNGPNGSGKTTLLRTVAGLLATEEGRIFWNGTAIDEDRQAYHADLVWAGHQPGFKGDLTLAENLRFEAGLRTMTTSANRHLVTLGLAQLGRIPFRALSAGQQRRAALARMLMASARLWLMDEPFTNLDAGGQQVLVAVLREHLAGGGMCLMASHHDVEIDAATVHRIHLQ